MIDFSCPNCGQELSAENDLRGEIVQCPQCGESVKIPNVFKLPEKKRQISIRSSSQRECPFCGELIQKSATKCRYCGEWLMGKNRARRSFAEEYGIKASTPFVPKPGSVKFAVFLSFLYLAFTVFQILTEPYFSALFPNLNPQTGLIFLSVFVLIYVLFILGMNAGMNWIRWFYLILTPLGLIWSGSGFLLMPNIGSPIFAIANIVFQVCIFFCLASESAGRWYRAIANGQNR